MIATAVTSALLWVVYLILGAFEGIDTQHVDFIMVFILIQIVIIMTPYLYLSSQEQKLRTAFKDRINQSVVTKLQMEEAEIASQAEGGTLDFASLWLATQKRMDVYHDLATTQAESSFRVGRIAAIAGFFAVFALGVLATFAANGTAAIAASVVGVAAAGMSGYIGATFMKAQAEASAQLRQFFLQPVETARLLGLERLIETLEPDHRAQAVMVIVKTMSPQQEQPADNQWVLQRLSPNGK